MSAGGQVILLSLVGAVDIKKEGLGLVLGLFHGGTGLRNLLD